MSQPPGSAMQSHLSDSLLRCVKSLHITLGSHVARPHQLANQHLRTVSAVATRGARPGQPVTLRRSRLLSTKAGKGSNGALAGPVDANSLRVVDTELHVEAEQSYLAYAMSVIVGRALPDVRDGLKPVQRRILFAMHDLGLTANKPHRKCARVVGEVLGKYHPHGDTAVYNALVRLAQDFSMQERLIDGHGNFGSVDNDPAAAMRYTECRLRPLSSAMLLADLDSDTVKFAANFDESQFEPTVMPARIPHLLVNGASGIAVGIATNIPPHNLREVVDGLCALIHDPEITVKQLMQHIPAPDFPTGGEIMETDLIGQAYHEGRGSITVRGKARIEDEQAASPAAGSSSAGSRAKVKAPRKAGSGKPQIIITELPYQSNKADFVQHIAKLAEDGTITGLSDIRDESDRDGMRVVVEMKRGTASEVVLANLYKHTVLQTRFACNMVALVDGTPLMLNLKQFLSHFLEFRCDVVRRRAQHELEKAGTRLHLVQGFLKAMADLDKVVAIIRKAEDSSAASTDLQDAFGMSKEQAEGVLNLSLRRLTSLEEQKLQAEDDNLTVRITDLEGLLRTPARVLEVVEKEAREVADTFGRPRRSTIMDPPARDTELETISVIPNEPSIIVFSKRGYIKRMRADTFNVQNRNGKGKAGATLKSNDSMEDVLHVMSHDSILFFTDDGIARSLKAYQIPEVSRTAVGTAITQVLPISKTANITAMLSVTEFTDDDFLVMLTADGLIKKTPLSRFQKMMSNGLTAIKLRDGDKLRWVDMCTEKSSVIVALSSGRAAHFATDEKHLRATSRTAEGVRAYKSVGGTRPIGMAILPQGLSSCDDAYDGKSSEAPWILLVTAKGMAKRFSASNLPVLGRNSVGKVVIKTNEGDQLIGLHVVGVAGAEEEEEVLFGSAGGIMSRIPLSSIRIFLHGSSKGVSAIRLQARLLDATCPSQREDCAPYAKLLPDHTLKRPSSECRYMISGDGDELTSITPMLTSA